MSSALLPWYILLVPLVAAGLIVLLTKSRPGVSSFISIFAVVASFAMSCVVFATPNIQPLELTWIDLKPTFYVPFGFVLDDLAKTMLLLVTGVGAVIHVYSLGYMRDDPGKSRYFASLSFFMFSMIGSTPGSSARMECRSTRRTWSTRPILGRISGLRPGRKRSSAQPQA